MGKGMVFGDADLRYAIDALSKSALADLVVDMATIDLGGDPTSEQLMTFLQKRIDTVLRVRGDRPVSLFGMVKRKQKNEAKYIERQKQQAEERVKQQEQELAMKAKIDEYKAEQDKLPVKKWYDAGPSTTHED